MAAQRAVYGAGAKARADTGTCTVGVEDGRASVVQEVVVGGVRT
jgi:hypothetical protein